MGSDQSVSVDVRFVSSGILGEALGSSNSVVFQHKSLIITVWGCANVAGKKACSFRIYLFFPFGSPAPVLYIYYYYLNIFLDHLPPLWRWDECNNSREEVGTEGFPWESQKKDFCHLTL